MKNVRDVKVKQIKETEETGKAQRFQDKVKAARMKTCIPNLKVYSKSQHKQIKMNPHLDGFQ